MHNEISGESTENDKYNLICQTMDHFNASKDGELYLFIVGISKYYYNTNISSCKNQARTFIDIFKDDYKVKRKNTYALFDKNATKRNILAHLSNFENLLSKDDQLIIYFAGHGYETEYANFFVPTEGDKNNLTSFIPNGLISKMVSSYHASSLLLFDLCLADNINHNYKKLTTPQENVHHEQGDIFKVPHHGHSHIKLKAFLDFVPGTLHRQCFLYLKENLAMSSSAANENLSNQYLIDNLLQLTTDIYKKIYQLLTSTKLDEALHELDTIVATNDEDLHSRVETLRFNFNLLTHPEEDHYHIVERSSKKEIKQLATEVLEKINDNGFYLIKTPQEIRAQQPKERTKILFTSANPRDENYLRLKTEERSIEYELMKAKYRDNFELIKRRAVDIDDLQEVLLNEAPQFIHFSGHGNCDGIALLNNLEEAQIVQNKPLAQLFKMFATDIRCIFLNSCHSFSQSAEISKFIENVVCMNKAVPDDMAIHFAGKFYQSIGAGKDIRFSFEFAKNSIDLNDIVGSDIPVLLELN